MTAAEIIDTELWKAALVRSLCDLENAKRAHAVKTHRDVVNWFKNRVAPKAKAHVETRRPLRPGSVPDRILNALNGHPVTVASVRKQFPGMREMELHTNISRLVRRGLITRVKHGTILKVQPQRERGMAHDTY